MGLTEQEVLDINSGWRETTANAMRAVAKGGGWVWQMFSGVGGPSGTGDTCAKSLREQCKTQNNRMSMMGLSLKDSHSPGSLKDPKGDVAKFLLVRGIPQDTARIVPAFPLSSCVAGRAVCFPRHGLGGMRA